MFYCIAVPFVLAQLPFSTNVPQDEWRVATRSYDNSAMRPVKSIKYELGVDGSGTINCINWKAITQAEYQAKLEGLDYTDTSWLGTLTYIEGSSGCASSAEGVIEADEIGDTEGALDLVFVFYNDYSTTGASTIAVELTLTVSYSEWLLIGGIVLALVAIVTIVVVKKKRSGGEAIDELPAVSEDADDGDQPDATEEEEGEEIPE